MQKNRVAMVAPSFNAYSETFIQAQKNGLNAEVFYYYGGELPLYLEGVGKLKSRFILWSVRIKRRLGLKTFSVNEAAFIHSLQKNKIQVVLAQYGTTANRIAVLCEALNIPLITHFHGYDASINAVIKRCNNYKEVFSYSTCVVAVSHSMKNRLIEMGCPTEKIVYNPYGPDNSFVALEPQFKEPLFIGIGRFVNKKAPYYTILAFKQIAADFPHASLVIGGEGELYETCRNLIQYYQLGEKVLLPGILSREEFLGYLEKGLAFVQHSITALNGDQEGTPVAVLEASAAGLPVISTFHAGIPDVIIDGETGFLVKEHDVNAMADRMRILLKDQASATRLGKNGKNRMESYFTLEKHLNTLDKLIDKVIKEYV